jgi:endonuclease/exonuclease/phosphatase family metal-dependent hydrolase
VLPPGEETWLGIRVNESDKASRDALWAAIQRMGTGATVDISLAHLRCAAAGRLMAPLQAVLNALLSGDQGALKRALKDRAFGEHWSPWDALAGIAATLAALREARPLAA